MGILATKRRQASDRHFFAHFRVSSERVVAGQTKGIVDVNMGSTETATQLAERLVRAIVVGKGGGFPIVLDWASVTDKDSFLAILSSLADELRERRPELGAFVFANIPWELKGFLSETAKYFSVGTGIGQRCQFAYSWTQVASTGLALIITL